MHAPLLQTRPVAHAWPFFVASGVVVQVCCAEHTPTLQGTGAQSAAAFEQLYLQVVSQPLPGPFAFPLSHCSGGVTMPSPQTPSTHLPPSQSL
jgi:hypothetical protein